MHPSVFAQENMEASSKLMFVWLILGVLSAMDCKNSHTVLMQGIPKKYVNQRHLKSQWTYQVFEFLTIKKKKNAHSLFSRFFSYIQAKLKTEHDSLGSPRREISIQGLTCCRISVKPGCLFFISSQWFSDSFMYACKSTRSQFIPIATSQVSWKCLTFWTEALKGRRQTT